MSISVGVVGAAGFAGAELLRLLAGHPLFRVKVITSDSQVGMTLAEVVPGFASGLSEYADIPFSSHDDPALSACDVVFLAVPHTAALKIAPALIEQGVTVIDLSADYRLKDPAVYEAWYATKHDSPELLSRVAFGLPELFRVELEAAGARREDGEAVLVACAGCYPTASTLAAYPALDEGLVSGSVIIDAISGVTGAGKSATERTHFCFANENVEAYAVGKHRHTPEIEQILGLPGQVIFTPHLAPLNRGLLATVYLPLASGTLEGSSAERTLADIHSLYLDFYDEDPFVQVLPLGQLPKTANVAGTNVAQIGLALQESTQTLIAVGAIDNLCKGAAGQALQCANIVFGLPETQGLEGLAYYV